MYDQTNNLILLKSISLDSKNENRIFTILDTLVIPNMDKHELITIGYCQINNGKEESLIAITEKTGSLKIQNIKKVWKANTTSEKIEQVNNLNGIECWNELFDQ